ncbi:MAG: hypothetical protein HOP13_00350 [Alphaproteobacteria bacterium]|nr:hypothetical protein [Alphaproteobacteria bacterium]
MPRTIGPYGWMAIALLLLGALSLYLIFGRIDGMQVNAGFLLLGLVAGTFVSLAVEIAKRPIQARDLARALHVELAEFVARCCFDFENPWQKLFANDHKSTEMHQLRLSKFIPETPIVYESTANQLALLKGSAPQALVQFYYRVAAWRRDASNMALSLRAAEDKTNPNSLAPPPTLDSADARFLSRRLKETLRPGLDALVALGSLVDNAQGTEDAAIAAHDLVSRPGVVVTEMSLRKRIETLVSS